MVVNKDDFYREKPSTPSTLPSSPDTLVFNTFFDQVAFDAAVKTLKGLLKLYDQKEPGNTGEAWTGFGGGKSGGAGASDYWDYHPSFNPYAERKLYNSGKHGIKWKEGPARARAENLPQGQFGNEQDIDFAVKMAQTLGPNKEWIFRLPEGNSSVVHLPDGGIAPATHVFVKTYPNGKVHAYPLIF